MFALQGKPAPVEAWIRLSDNELRIDEGVTRAKAHREHADQHSIIMKGIKQVSRLAIVQTHKKQCQQC